MRESPWSVTVTCEFHGLIGQERLLSDAQRERLIPFWRASVEKHHAVCRNTVVTRWLNNETEEVVEDVVPATEAQRPVKLKRLIELATLEAGDVPIKEAFKKIRAKEIIAMANELLRYRAMAVDNVIVEASNDEQWTRILAMPVEEFEAELREAGYSKADQIQRISDYRFLITASLQRNEALRENAALRQQISELQRNAK